MMTSRTKCGSILSLWSEEGKGAAGCLLFLLLMVIVIFVGIKIWPDYYACKSLDTALKTEVSRAGANFLDNESLMKNILLLAKKNEIKLDREQVKIERFAGQIFVTVNYYSPVDLLFYTWHMSCDIKASSFIGRL